MTRTNTDKFEDEVAHRLLKLAPEAASAVAFRSALRVQPLGFQIAPSTVTAMTAGPTLWSLLVACAGAIKRDAALKPILEVLNEGALMNRSMQIVLSVKDMERPVGRGELAQASLIGCVGNAFGAAAGAAQTSSLSSGADRAAQVVSSSGLAAQASALSIMTKEIESDQEKFSKAMSAAEALRLEVLNAANTDIHELLPSGGLFRFIKGNGRSAIEILRAPLWPRDVPKLAEQAQERFTSTLKYQGLGVVADWHAQQLQGWLHKSSPELNWIGQSEVFWSQDPDKLGKALEASLN